MAAETGIAAEVGRAAAGQEASFESTQTVGSHELSSGS